MRRFNLAAVVVLVVAGLFAVASAGQQADATKIQKWEYKSLVQSTTNANLDVYGEEGWELCVVLPDNGSTIYYLKRPKQ